MHQKTKKKNSKKKKRNSDRQLPVAKTLKNNKQTSGSSQGPREIQTPQHSSPTITNGTTNHSATPRSTDLALASVNNCWGHALAPKPPNTIRLILQNVGGINLKPEGLVKLAALCSFMQEAQVDIVALTECNVAWWLIDQDLLPTELTNSGGKTRTGQ